MLSRRECIKLGALASGSLALLGSERLRGQALSRTLKAAAGAKGLLAGCAVGSEQLRHDGTYRKMLSEQYSLVVGENCMKFGPLRPSPTSFIFQDADALVAFAEQHGMKIRGHNFVWHHQLPSWFASDVNKVNAKQVMIDHILTVGGRYKGKIQSWDVVNEALNPSDGLPGGLRKSPWLELIGPDYIETAFRAAKMADPQAKLTYNDYGIEYDYPDADKKRNDLLVLLRGLKNKGVPVDALGIQSHLAAGSGARFGGGVCALIDAVQALGMEVYITEMDVNDDKVVTDDVAARDRAVAEIYEDYLDDVLQSRAVKAVLTWGFTDRYTWLDSYERDSKKHPYRKERPLPFDVDYRPKPAFQAIYSAFSHAPERAGVSVGRWPQLPGG